MKKIIGFYFNQYVLFSKIAIVVPTLWLFITTTILLLDHSYVFAIAGFILGLWILPYCLIAIGLLKNNNLSLKLIDLSAYYFQGDNLATDFHISIEELKRLDSFLKAKLIVKGNGAILNVSELAREVAIELRLNEKQYLYLLIRAASILGSHREKGLTTKKGEKVDFEAKIAELRKNLEKDKTNNPDKYKPKDNPKEDSDDKYGFL
jgi:hypothetical protein